MKSFSIFLLLITAPYTVCADCIITDTSEKFEIVCSGPDPMTTPLAKKKAKKAYRADKTKKVNYEDRMSDMQEVVMNETESQFMVTRNKQDGYRATRKPRGQTSKKSNDTQDHTI
ncbi:MAG: hypothetical protein ACYDHC_13990 [Desulfuromonadaceae bacterium]